MIYRIGFDHPYHILGCENATKKEEAGWGIANDADFRRGNQIPLDEFLREPYHIGSGFTSAEIIAGFEVNSRALRRDATG
jgi:hypothetical protein